MIDAKFSRRKVKAFLRTMHSHRKRLATKNILSRVKEISLDVQTPLQESIHGIKQLQPPPENNKELELVRELLTQLTARLEEREDKIERIHTSLRNVQSMIDKITQYEEDEKKEKLTVRQKHLLAVEQQLAAFEERLIQAAQHYQDDALFPLKQKIEELKQKYQDLVAKEGKEELEPAVQKEETEVAEELRKKIEELEIAKEIPTEAERRIEEEVTRITEEIALQEVQLDLPEFVVPEEEELSLPSPFPEGEIVSYGEEELLPPPPIPKKQGSVLDSLVNEVKRLLLKT